MAHVYLDDELIDALRPTVEDEWERSRREAGKKQVSDSEVVTRILKAAFNSTKKRQAL
jgi:hypothetical protein